MNDPSSPHKLTHANKMRRYEEGKDNLNSGVFQDNLSPTKGFGTRTNIGGKNFGMTSPMNISSNSPVKASMSGKTLNINKIRNSDSPILAQDSPKTATMQRKPI